MAYQNVFSNFEIKNASIKFNDDTAGTFTKLGCVGSADEELAVTVISKNCEGVLAKTVSRGAGSGTVSMSLHMKYDLYVKAFGMDQEGLKDGVMAYGRNSRHKEFTLVAQIFDEDGNEKLIAYPRAIMASAPAFTIENGAEEVAEIEIEINLFADDDGNVKYEVVVDDKNKDSFATWMTNWTSTLVKNAQA